MEGTPLADRGPASPSRHSNVPPLVVSPIAKPTDHSSLSAGQSMRPRNTGICHGLSSVTWNSGGVAPSTVAHGHESSFSIDPQKLKKLEARMVRIDWNYNQSSCAKNVLG